MYKHHYKCRACGGSRLEAVVNFGLQPLANDFKKPDEGMAGFAPLEVFYCNDCSLAQLSVVVDPSILYSNYSYVTSPSQTMFHHFTEFLVMLRAETENNIGNVLEIGSNDGLFLSFLKPCAKSVFGVDPAVNLAQIANSNGLSTCCAMFDSQMAKSLSKFDTIIARHVFAHMDDWQDFVAALDVCSHEGTVIAIEVPYAKQLLERREFDTIYHEHLSYVSLRSVNALLAGSPFFLSSVHHFDIHGGSMALILRKRQSNSVSLYNDLISAEDWRKLGVVAREMLDSLKIEVRRVNFTKARVAGYGAPAKAAIWINTCEFSKTDIEFVHDVTAQKQDRLIPGTNIPIFNGRQRLAESITHAILFAWNYESEIMENEKQLIKNGLNFIVPTKIKL